MYNVYIRPLKVEDALISYKWRNDPDIWQYTGNRPDTEIIFDIENQWIKKVITEEDSKRFAIIADNVYIGNIQLTNIDNTSAEYHIFIGDKNWWGKGISHLATFQLLYFAKEQLNLNRIYLSVRTGNEAAIKSYLKSQFVIESSDEDWLKMTCNLVSLSIPTVSVFVMVYNHEKYLAECLDGILMQKCGFNYDIVVGEDCSADNSRAILLEYGKKYPGKFKLLLHDENIGAVRNQEEVFKACTGKYIAMCEGDDYWIDSVKLQKQLDILNENNDCSIAFHPCYKEENNILDLAASYVKSTITTTVFSKNILELQGQFAPTSSYFFKREVLKKLPKWIADAPVGDYFLEMYALKDSYGLFMCEAMSVYRINTSVSWTKNILGDFKKNIDFNLKMASCLKLMMSDFAEDLRQYFEFHIATKYLNCCLIYLKIGDFKRFKSFFHQYNSLKPTKNLLFYKLKIISSDRKLFTYFRILRKIG